MTTLLSFTGASGAVPGEEPTHGLLADGAGNFYGTTRTGGSFGGGVIYRFTSSGAYQALVHFNVQGVGPTPGSGPTTLVLAPDGNLYGTSGGYGRLFRLTPAGTFTDLYEFSGNGAAPGPYYPSGGLTVGPDGNLYGTTIFGGVMNAGTFYRVALATGVVTMLNAFPSSGPAFPRGGLAPDSAGNLYFTTMGGYSSAGTVQKLAPSGAVSTVVEFTGASGSAIGLIPSHELEVDPDGNVYGTTAGSFGYRINAGTVFRIAPDGTFTTLVALTGNEGSNPAGVIRDTSGNLFGATLDGLVFKVAPGGAYSVVGRIDVEAEGEIDELPSRLTLDSAGNLYGVWRAEDEPKNDRIFKLAPDGGFTRLASFRQSGTGLYDISAIVREEDGTIVGTAGLGRGSTGGAFKISPSGNVKELPGFGGAGTPAPGVRPQGELVRDGAGNVWGVANGGGANGTGTIFRIAPTGQVIHAFDLPAGSFGANGRPYFSADGWAYWTAARGGPLSAGSVNRARFGPTPTTLPADAITNTAATLHAKVDPRAEATVVTFEYGTTTAFGSETAPIALPADAVLHDVSAPLTGLTAGSIYFVRAKAVSASGTQFGATIVLPTGGNGRFGAWLLAHFGDAYAHVLDDSDHDGAPALLEYAMGTDPLAPDARPLVGAFIGPPFGVRRLALTFQRYPERDDITLEVQGANSPAGPWTTIATSANGGPFTGPAQIIGDSDTPGMKTVEVRDTYSFSSRTPEARRFVRVRVWR